jgi:hypothetical protein
MLPFGVTILATVPQRSEIPEGLLDYPVYISGNVLMLSVHKINKGRVVRLQRMSETANHICANFRLRGTHAQT